ncbi:MAG: ABC transporter ATP-binding protein [Planctomycetota bacterium]|nr:ABC transporter ATP-binding protein [Planctomycetota bacterium]
MSELATQPAAMPSQKNGVILRATDVRKTFRIGDSELQILKKVNLSVQTGEFVAIEGRSGSGKSTLLHIMGALDRYDGGKVVFDGQDIADLSAAQKSGLRNRQFGFVFQFYHLLPELNVLENTMLAAMIEHSWLAFASQKVELKARAIKLLEQLGMEQRLRHRPQQLSGGERQRVAIARALMNQPRVLFADEPTGNLDFDTGRQIMALLERLHSEQKQTIIMVTHDRSLARQADRVLVLKNGVLEAVDAAAREA